MNPQEGGMKAEPAGENFRLPAYGSTVTECANVIRGKAGPIVRLEVLDPQRHTTNTIELTRQKFVLTKK